MPLALPAHRGIEYIAVEKLPDGSASLVTRHTGESEEIRSVLEYDAAIIAAHHMLRPEWFSAPVTRC